MARKTTNKATVESVIEQVLPEEVPAGHVRVRVVEFDLPVDAVLDRLMPAGQPKQINGGRLAYSTPVEADTVNEITTTPEAMAAVSATLS
jgi:hypothetical protein